MDKIWLKSYPKGIPHEINPDAYSSIVDLFNQAVEKHRFRPSFINMGKQISYLELEQMSRHLAAFFQKDLGLKKGDRIAIMLPNLLQYPVALFAALRAGLIVVNTNPLYTPREMEHQFKDSGARALVVLANMAHHLPEVLPKTKIEHVIVTEVGDLLGFPKSLIVNFAVKYIKKMVKPFHLPQKIGFRDALIRGAAKSFDSVSVAGNDIAFLQYTGGTTGVSKGAVLTHRNIVANMEQLSAWIRGGLTSGNETIATPLPLYHIFSLTVNCLAMMREGATNLLITNPRDLKSFIADLKKHPVSIITAVNTLFVALLNNEEFVHLDFSRLKLSVGGGMAVQTATAERWKKVTGNPLVEAYGLTETAPGLTANPIDGTERMGSIGLPLPNTEIKMVKDDGQEAAIGEPGEIWARGPQVMQGYWNRPDETEKVMVGDWFKTGDIGVMMADGYSKIVDRKKDMILVSGFNVYPNEIEDVIAKHPGVLEVAAVGVPDSKSGEVVKIFVVKRDQSLDEEILKKFCRENLTGYKVPRFIEFRKDLPKSNVGKILRRELRT
jgi:long-chain acyl-CoA synthetase